MATDEIGKAIHTYDAEGKQYNYNIEAKKEGFDIESQDFDLNFNAMITAGSLGFTLKSNKDFSLEPALLSFEISAYNSTEQRGKIRILLHNNNQTWRYLKAFTTEKTEKNRHTYTLEWRNASSKSFSIKIDGQFIAENY